MIPCTIIINNGNHSTVADSYAMIGYKGTVCGGQKPSWVGDIHGLYPTSGTAGNNGLASPPVYITAAIGLTDSC